MITDSKLFSRFTYFRGRVALAEILLGLGVGPGDLVAIQAFTCVAVPEAVMATGAKPLWIDIEDDGVNMSPTSLENNWQKTVKAVVVQHTFGMMANMDELEKVIGGRAPIIEDCCHTYMSSLGGKLAGNFGIASFYSFEWGKPLILGAGGAALTSDPDLSQKLAARLARFHPPSRIQQFKLFIQYIGFSILYRPSLYWTVKALFRRLSGAGLAVGNYNSVGPGILSKDFETSLSRSAVAKLKRKFKNIEADSKRRRDLAKVYTEAFNASGLKGSIKALSSADNVLIRFPYVVDDKPALLSRAEENRIEVAEWYATPVHPLTNDDWHLVNYIAGSCPNAECMAKHLVSFPMGASVSLKNVEKTLGILVK